MRPSTARQWRSKKFEITHVRGREVCANLNRLEDRPLGTVWVWDSSLRRPQLRWAWGQKSSDGS